MADDDLSDDLRCPIVLVVYFTNAACVPRWHFMRPDQRPTTLFDLPLWIPTTRDLKERQIFPVPAPKKYVAAPVYRWAVDYVACGDERWTVFGPFASRTEARAALKTIPAAAVEGYRCVPQHCYQDLLPVVREVWTDG